MRKKGEVRKISKKFEKKKLKSVDDEKSPCYYIKAFHEIRNVRDRWRFSSVGRASALQAEGQRFEPVNLHHFFLNADLAQLAEQLICNQ